MNSPKKFVGLHAHTGFSAFDGLGHPEEHIDYAIENGMDAMALTEHGNMASFPQADLYSREMRKKGKDFKYIPGVEAYYHPDLSEWRHQKFLVEESKKDLKRSKDDDEQNVTTENEEETKNSSKWSNPINRRHHLVLLAKSKKGLENIFRLVSKSYKDGFYKFPRIDRKMLKEHGEDIIVSSACVGGVLAYDVLSEFGNIAFDDMKPDLLDDARVMNNVLMRMGNTCDQIIDAVGKENFFAEIQFNKLGAQHTVNRAIFELHKKGINIVAAADSHYSRPELWADREIYKKLGRLNYEQINPDLLPKDISSLKCELYPKNASQMWDAYKQYSQEHSFYDDNVVSNAIENSWHIAHDMINEILLDSKMKLPSFVVPNGMTPFNALVELCKEGLVKRGLAGKKEYVTRLKHELEIIKKKEFAQYFLTTKAFLDLAHENMLIGAGRGSGAGSLVNYVLGITNLDPIRYGLIFERFISPSRKDEPDIDNDVADRDLLINRMKEKFGDENVVPITNFNTLQLKSLVKDISRLYNVPFEEANEVTSHLDAEVRPQANNTGENKSLFQLKYDDCLKYSERFRNFIEKYPQVGKHINVLYKQQKSLGRHAGGVIIVEDPEKYMPLITVRGEVQTPWAEGMHIKNCSPYGLIKFDILGLETLRMIQRCIELILKAEGNENPTFEQIKRWYDDNLAPGKIDECDQKVFDHVFNKKRFAGIFQFTARHTQRFIHEFEPTSVDDLAIATAIYRPGPLAAKADKLYIKRKRGEETIKADHPAIEKVLGPTYMLPVFQEQIMSLAHELAGMSLDDCDRLRKAILKRSVTGMSKNKSETEVLEEMFIEGAVKNGYEREKAQKLYDDVRAFSSYAFNKSHSVAYAFCSYQTAWLMTYYEPQWLCSYIESMIGDPDSRSQAIAEIKSLGYKIGKVDINKSSYRWEVNVKEKKFFPSFRTVKGIGDAAIEEILRFRPYKTVEDILWRKDDAWKHSKFNKKALESLIKIGAFDSINAAGQKEDSYFSNYRQMYHTIIDNLDKLKKKNGRELLHKLKNENSYEDDWTVVEKIQNHKEILGDFDVTMIVGQDLQDYLYNKGANSLDNIEDGESVAWFILTKYQQKMTKNKKPYLLLTALDSLGRENRIFAWGAPDGAMPDVNCAYLSPVEKNTFGLSLKYYRMKKMDVL